MGLTGLFRYIADNNAHLYILNKYGRRAMKLASVYIRNYRGIHNGKFIFPLDQRLICIIGSGDSCKSTFLKAIEWVLWPAWNLNVSDLDFYNMDTTNPITIEASISEIPEDLLTEDRYGLYLRDYEAAIRQIENDEPSDDRAKVLTIRLMIDESLEPEWTVITNRTEPKQISQKDRRLFALGVVGFDYEKDFAWGRTSILQKFANSSNKTLHMAYMQAMRTAVDRTDLSGLDESIADVHSIGQQFGVSFDGTLHNRLLMQNGSYSNSVGMFDDRVPFLQRGLGSKRLLSMGMNIHFSTTGCLILIDEIETGLEPYRLCTLINHLRSEFKDKGQIIFTTHSRSAVCECSVEQLSVMTKHNGDVSWFMLSEQDTRDTVQALIRTDPDAFLCKRLIICEGKTEIGMLRAFDDYIYTKTGSRFAHDGVGTALGGGGDNFFKLAKILKKCGYDVCILMDSDLSEEEEKKREAENLGIKVFSWEAGNAIEEQIFVDVDTKTAEAMINIACEVKSIQHVLDKLNLSFPASNKPFFVENDLIHLIDDCSEEIRRKIGTIAKNKKCEWFKRIGTGQQIGYLVLEQYEVMDQQSGFKSTMENLKRWIVADET